MAIDWAIAQVRPLDSGGVEVRTRGSTTQPGRYDIEVRQGQRFDLHINWIDGTESTVDLSSGYTSKLTAKKRPTDTDKVIEWGSASGEVTLAASAPNIQLLVEQADTEDLTGFLQARYELVISKTAGLQDTILLEGFVALVPTVL